MPGREVKMQGIIKIFLLKKERMKEMRYIKRICILGLVITSLSVTAFSAELTPNEVVKGLDGEIKIIEKVYVLPKEIDEGNIPTENFTEDETEYSFVELKSQDNTKEETKEHREKVSIYSNTNNTQDVIQKFEPSIEISTEDGYIGTIKCDYSTLNVSAAGYGKRNYTISESRSYPNLADSDTSLVPKNIEKDGNTLNLTNISWQAAASDNVDGYSLATRYTAHATYMGTGTKTYTTGYTASLEYVGEVKKVTNDSITYTAVFREVEKESDVLRWLLISLGALIISGGTCAGYILIRKRKKGY